MLLKKVAERDLSGNQEGSLVKQESGDSVSLTNYKNYDVQYMNASSMNPVYRTNLVDAKVFTREDGEVIYESKDGTMRTVETATGTVLNEYAIPDGYEYGARIGDYVVLSTADTIRIDRGDGSTLATLKDASLEKINEKRGLVFYRNAARDTWYVYDVSKEQIVLEKKTGEYANVMQFGEGRYALIDYVDIYDMDTWEKVLSLKSENGNVYGAQTTKDCPYFVIWCRKTEESSSGKEIACLYEKGGNGELVGVIDNYVAMTPDAGIVVYDGADTLYKIPLLSVDEIKKKAEQMVGDAAFSESQKEKYHLFR